ncbi:amidohydrolase family protein [Panacibacter sp. DH6]|uniref:Amidohydrolase family protein n=1 Tax=Panacibacter microcysteis TaxID=2793269 RepID=A0A931E7U1_9BACT|nr:amidohydrolase family protein [Panacibacter microcysteis]MBG9376971.1 amidohydrolase family protein [Panacibacter microcysteis]
MKYTNQFLLVVGLFTFSLLTSLTGYSQKQPAKQTIFAIKNVNVITMTSSNTILENATVVISNNLIQSINGAIPKNATIINGKGKWLIPGLIDAHVHLPTDGYLGQKFPTQIPDLSFNTQDIMTPIIANGVTTVLDLNSTMETFGQKKLIEKGYIVGPRIALAALINGGNGQGRIANTAEEGRIMVRNVKTEGYDFIKVYSKLNIETYNAIVDEAYKQGVKTIGHIPYAFKGKLEQAFIPHFGMVAHAEEFSKNSDSFCVQDAIKFAKLSKDNGTWLSPTLTTMVWIAKQTHSINSIKNLTSLKYVHPLLQSKWLTANNYVKNASSENATYFDNMVKFHFQLVKAFNDAGIPIVAGTDAGVSGVVAGFSLHDELELLVQAGLTPKEALNSATLLSAQWLGIDKQLGSIETGKFADLILLDQDPLTDIRNTRKIAGVFVNGNWLDKTKLNSMLEDLANRNTADKDQFDWKTFMNKKK